MVAVGVWVARSPDVQAALLPPEETRRLVEEDFASYYSSDPASSFAARVWTNNAWLAAVCLITGVLILPVLWVLLQNVVNVGLCGGHPRRERPGGPVLRPDHPARPAGAHGPVRRGRAPGCGWAGPGSTRAR